MCGTLLACLHAGLASDASARVDDVDEVSELAAREYCARYPSWRLISFPGEGELVAYSRAAEVLDLVAAEIARTADPAAPPHR